MFHVRDQNRQIQAARESFEDAKSIALQLKEKSKQNYTIDEVKQVWTTQTLDEVINSK